MKMFLKLVLMGILFQCKSSCAGKWNIPVPGSNHDSIHAINEMAVDIFSKCYADIKEVVIHGDAEKSTFKSLRESESLATIVYNNGSLIDDPVKLRLHHNLFVLTPRFASEVEKVLFTFRNSRRWNVMAPFFILDNSNKKCRNVRSMMISAMNMQLTESFFLCVDSDNVPMVYTHNRYAHRAPQQWNEASTASEKKLRSALYARRYGADICEGFRFDRTKRLDGSTVKIAIVHPDLKTFTPYKYYTRKLRRLYPEDDYAVDRLEYSLNVTVIFNIVDAMDSSDHIRYGSYDVLMVPHKLSRFGTYVAQYDEFHIVTNNRGKYTPVENILNFYGMVTLVSLCVILPMTFIVIVLSEKTRRWSFAGFEILRLLINTGLHTRMDTIALRIFFSMIFLYFLILHAMFQGHIVNFLMNQEPRKNAETLMDLRDRRYDAVHIFDIFESFFTDPILNKKLVLHGVANHILEIIGKDSAAAICDKSMFLVPSFEHELHVSKEPVFIEPFGYILRDDWPLKERFNLFLMWLESSGQSATDFKNRWAANHLERHKRIMAMSVSPDIRPISMSMLHWIFIFWLIGLKLAALSITFERKIRDDHTRRMDNREAARRNAEKRRRDLINQIISNPHLAAGSRPRSI